MRNLLAFPDESRVWIYQAGKPFGEEDVQAINEEIEDFCEQWTSHNHELHAIGGIIHDQFVVLIVDQTRTSASGCSIDKSVAFIKNLEKKYNCSLLERDKVAWLDEDEQIHTIPLSQLKDAIGRGEINMENKVFDNLVSTRKDFIQRWTVPLSQSWMRRFT